MNEPARKEIIKLPVFSIVIFSMALLLFILSVVSLWLAQPIVTMIRSAVVLEEPVLEPENEGNVILLHGKIEARTPIEEPVFGLTFDSPALCVKETAYAYDKNDSYYSPGAGEHFWEKQSEQVYTIDATLGEFRIDSRLLSLINTPVSVNGTTCPAPCRPPATSTRITGGSISRRPTSKACLSPPASLSVRPVTATRCPRPMRPIR